VVRVPARDLAPDSDLGDRLVTQGVGDLSSCEIATALDAGVAVAQSLLSDGLIRAAALRLRGETNIVGSEQFSGFGTRPNPDFGWSSASALH
jgi:hypothetical protein